MILSKETKRSPWAKKIPLPEYNQLKMAADILGSIDDYVSAFDRNWNIVYLNATTARAFGFSAEELIGKNFWATFPNFVGTALEKNYREAMDKRVVRRFEWRTIYARPGYWEFTVFPSPGGITVYGVDISQRKLLQQKVEEYTKNLEKLVEERTSQLKEKEHLATIGATAGMVGHDIRNPLQAIVSELYLAKDAMKEAKVDANDALESIDFIEQQVDYISKIVSDLQDYAKPLKPELTLVKLNDYIEKTLKTIKIPKNVETSIAYEKAFSVNLDKTLMMRVLTNLVTNAVQAMPNGGKIVIRTLQRGGKALLIVEDTGMGIPENVKPMIFKPLFTTKAKGQGFGLPVVKRLVEAQGGTITFESQVEKGTKFIIKLPLKQ